MHEGIRISQKAILDIIEEKIREDEKYAALLAAAGRWTLARIGAMPTEEIEARLLRCGVPWSREAFGEALRSLLSCERVAEAWRRKGPLDVHDIDDDLPFIASLELKRRLFPDIVTSEDLDDWMQEGYSSLKRGDTLQAVRVWGRVWRTLLDRLPASGLTTDQGDKAVRGLQSLYNWVQDHSDEMHNAGLKVPSFWEERLRYCREFVTVFSAEVQLVPHFLRTEAETLIMLGRWGEGDDAYERLLRAHPDWGWGYIGWGDEYWLWERNEAHRDLAKAEAIYQRGLRRPRLSDRKDLSKRLEDLHAEMGTAPPPAEEHSVPSVRRASIGSDVSRNAPCPCGSGKKFKRCCGR